MIRALKYGVLVTGIIAVYVALKHWGLHLDPARAAVLDTAVFNLAALIGLTLGISERRSANQGLLSFGEGMQTGVCIAIAYAALTALYFAILLLAVGPGIMQQSGEVNANGEVTGAVIGKAFAGVLIGMTVIGTILSLFVSLVLRRKAV
jgi:hypothetical protein